MTSLADFVETETQLNDLIAIEKCGGNMRQAARELGKNIRTLQRTVDRIKKKAAKGGWSPDHDMTKPTAPGYHVKGTSTLYDDAGNLKIQWVKTDLTQENQLEAISKAIDEKIRQLPALPRIKAPRKLNKDLCSLYTITDYHVGMYAWDKEAGDNWDTDIAQEVLVNTMHSLMLGTPNAETAILNIQGDFLHWDGLEAVTPTSGHPVDADTRYSMMVELGMDLVINCTEMLLGKHKKVKVIVCEGNHDLYGSAWLQKFVKKMFRNNKRVEVDDTAIPYYAHLHGRIMLGFHHGHKKKNTALPELFASEPRYREMWGKAKYTYIHTGHYHRTEQDMSECGGAIVERHPTLAARDAYAARGGWVSWRAARAITYHVEDGEECRVTRPPRYYTPELVSGSG
jgi:hypothetical protein